LLLHTAGGAGPSPAVEESGQVGQPVAVGGDDQVVGPRGTDRPGLLGGPRRRRSRIPFADPAQPVVTVVNRGYRLREDVV